MDNSDKKIKCPIPGTHARLNQAFSLFKNILEDYQDPLRFTSVLNNLIQNLRNVTFILQKELAHTENFPKWYSEARGEMKKDDILTWMVTARNHVVKEGDLKKKSFATVRLKNHFDNDLVKMEMDPTLSTEEIAEIFRNVLPLEVPTILLEQTLLEVERVWIVDDYPETEVIDILIYCFGVLTDLIYRAHEELLETNPLRCEENLYVDPLEDFMVVLHNQIRKGRITRINYKTRITYTGKKIDIGRPNDKIIRKAKEKYGDAKHIASLIDKSGINIPFNNLKYHLEMAKHLFSVDGFLVPAAFLYFEDRVPMHIFLGLDDPASKYLVFEDLAEKVEETHCEALILVCETWIGDIPEESEEYIPAYIQKKKECIWLIAATPEKTEQYYIPIIRSKDNEPSLSEVEKADSIEPPYSLDRIYKNWDIRKSIKNKSK